MPTLVLRPTATPVSASITSSSGTPHADLSDNNDTTVVRGSAEAAYAYFALTDITLSGTQRVKSVQVSARRGRDAADVGDIEEVRARIIDTVADVFGDPDYFRAYYPDQITEQGAERFTAPGGKSWSEPIVDAMQLEVKWFASQKGGLFLRVSELYVNVLTNSQPTVTAPTVSGASTTTRPGYTYAYADSDGDAQVRQEVKVYSAAQYGAGGFSPDTTAPVWTSGQVAAGNTAGTVGTDLVNGTTYKVYARAAQSWSGPLGSLWWSAWQSSAAFTIAIVPPPTPALTATPLVDLPAYRVQLAASAPVNLGTADEAGFDSGSVGTWAVDANAATPVTSTTNPKSGTGSMTMSSSAAGAMRYARAGFTAPPAGQTATVGGSARAATAGRSFRFLIRWRNAASTLMSTVTGASSTDTTTGYTLATATGAAPAGAVTYDAVIEVLATAAAAEVHRLDEFFAGTGGGYSPGGLSGQAVTVQRGERVNARRGPALNWAHPQVGTGGSTERMTSAGFRAPLTGDVLHWEPVDRSGYGDVDGWIHWQPRAGAGGYVLIGAAALGDERDWQFPVAPGLPHVVTVRAHAAAAFSSTLNIDWIGADGTTIIGVGPGSGISITTTPADFSTSYTAPAGAVYARATLNNTAGTTTNDVYFSVVGWGLGSAPVNGHPPAGGPLVWSTVRDLTEMASPIQPGSRVLLADSEIPPARPVLYRARTLATQGTTPVASDWSAPVGAYLPAPSDPIVLDPLHPHRAAVAEQNAAAVTVTEDAAVMHGLGRDGDPIRQVSWRSGEDSRLIVEAISYAEVARLRLILAAGNALLLQHHDGGQTYMLIDGWTREELSPIGNWWQVDAAYFACGRP